LAGKAINLGGKPIVNNNAAIEEFGRVLGLCNQSLTPLSSSEHVLPKFPQKRGRGENSLCKWHSISARKCRNRLAGGDPQVERRVCHSQALVLRPEIRQSFFGDRHDGR
jgi:hypothetical protein